jgi:chromosome segregation and condensation protein ScpB
MVEAMLFASAEPLGLAEMEARMPHGCDPAEALQLLRKRYEGRGVQVTRVGEGWAIRTAADLGFLMAREVVESRRLSRAAIETLAIIAYHQPVTRAEIEEIRGVSASRGTVDQLIELGWVRFGTAADDGGAAGDLRGDARLPRPFRAGKRARPAGPEGVAGGRASRQPPGRGRGGGVAARTIPASSSRTPRSRGGRGRRPDCPIIATFRVSCALIEKKGRAGPMDRIANMIIRRW